MKKSLILLVLAGILLTPSFSHVFAAAISEDNANKRDFRKELTGGMWHASPELGHGWSERLGLYNDSTFIYAAAELNGETRDLFIKGEWSVSSEGLLTLTCREVLKLEGGKVVSSQGLIETDTEIIDAKLVKTKYDPLRSIEIRVGEYVQDDNDETPHPWKIILSDGGAIWGGDRWWWKYKGADNLDELLDSYEFMYNEAEK